MRRYTALVLVSTFLLLPETGFSSTEMVREYKFWVVPGAVGAAALLVPQGLAVFYSRQLDVEFKNPGYNATAVSISTASLVAASANALSCVAAWPLLWVALRRFETTISGCSSLKVARHIGEGVFATSALAGAAFEFYAASNMMDLFTRPMNSKDIPQALTPTLVTSTISAIGVIFSGICSVALVLISCRLKANGYEPID